MVRAAWLLIAAALCSTLLVADPAEAQERPRHGGELVFLVPSEPPSYDGHREGTFGTVHPLAPLYNTLLRIDPTDRTGTRPVPDLAESWTISPDGMTYTFKLRQGVRFHDGSALTSRDVKASYDKIIFPPAGVVSMRKGSYQAMEAVETPDPATVRFRLKWPEASFLVSVASPYNWIYKADILARDIRWYETNVMGTGPFRFVEHVKGSHRVGKRNPDYWDKGKPYLDGYRALFCPPPPPRWRPCAASARTSSSAASPRRSRRARAGAGAEDHGAGEPLGLPGTGGHEPRAKALRRQAGAPGDDPGPGPLRGVKNLSRIAVVKEVAGIQVPGTPWATPPAELEKLAGYGRDIAANRAEARRLLREAGVPDGFTFTFKNRGIPQPYETVGIWLIDQWRQIGLNVKQEVIEASAIVTAARGATSTWRMDAQCSFVVEPDIDIPKFQSIGVSDNNYARYKDPVLDDLFLKQARAMDPEERKRHLRAFEKRLLDEEVHYIYTLQWHRIVPHSAKVRGWTITPAHYLNQQLDTVWLAE